MAKVQLPLYKFEINDLETLRTLMILEKQGGSVAVQRVGEIMAPRLALVGPDGQLPKETVKAMANRLNEFTIELAKQATLVESWVAASSTGKGHRALGSLSMASHQLSYIIYSEFGRILHTNAPHFLDVLDGVVLLGLRTLIEDQHKPAEVFEEAFTFTQIDKETGKELIHDAAAHRATCELVQDLLLHYLNIKGLIEIRAEGEDGNTSDPKTQVYLNHELARIYHHLASVTSLGKSFNDPKVQELLLQEIQSRQEEDMTEAEVVADLGAN